jgi:1-acyl-sn-glycerol-3-phosphate acyltransferase
MYRPGDSLVPRGLLWRVAAFGVYRTLYPIAYLLIKARYGTRFVGREYLRSAERAVIVANHTAYLDPIAIACTVFPRVAAQTLLEATVRTPVLGTFIRLLYGIPLPPGLRGIAAIVNAAKTVFERYHYIGFFPEGEISIFNQHIEPFHSGAFYVAATLNVPVIPIVMLLSTGPRKKNGKPRRQRPLQTIIVLPPVNPSDYMDEITPSAVKAFAESVRRIMQNEIDRRHNANADDGTQVFYRGIAPRLKGINAR